MQWLFFCLVCLLCAPQAGFGAQSAAALAPADKVTVPARADFAFAEPYFETLGQGKLPAPAISALLQDAQGWLWIGTRAGLFRYDGYRMRNFTHDPTNPTSLAGAHVTALWQAPDGRLWVGTDNHGVSIFDPQREQFTHLRYDPAHAPKLAGSRVWALVGDGKGGVWIGTNQGLVYVTDGAAPLRYYRHEPGNPTSLRDNRIFSLLLDKQGTLWVGGAGSLQRYQAAGPGKPASFVPVAFDPANPASLAEKTIRALFQARDGKLWLGTTKHGAAWLNLAEPDPTPHWLPIDPKRANHLSDVTVKTIIEPQAGQIWLGTAAGGINIVAAQDGTVLQRLQHDPANASSLTHDNIRTLLQDQSGTLWIGTLGGGLQRHHPAQQAFKVLRHRPARPAHHRNARPDVAESPPTGPGPSASLSHPEVRSALELSDGRLLVGTGGNDIDILDRLQGVVGNYRPDSPGGLSDGTIMALAQTPDGTLWAADRQAGPLRLAPGSDHWQTSTEGLPGPRVYKFLVDHNGVLWAATNIGIAHWQAGSQRFVTQQQLDGKALKVAVETLAEDQQGRLWAGSDHGLWLKTPAASGWQAILHQPGQPDSLPGNDVRGLLVDASNRLWVSTTKGLVRLQSWNGHTAVFEAISTKVGMPGQDFGPNLWQDQAGRIWLCKDGLLLLDPHTFRLSRNAQPDLGLTCTDTWPATRDGLLLSGGSQGLAIFDPAKFAPWTFQPPVRLTELKINGQTTPPGALLPHLRLTPDQRNFSVEFAALDFSQADLSKTRYRYQLQGYDKAWINTDSEQRLASYGNLWPGRYTLRVQGSNREGGWSVHELSIPIRVLPAWWQSSWFWVLVLLLSGSLLYAWFRWRVARLRAKARNLQKLVDARTSDILKLGKIGQELTATLDMEQALERVYRQVFARLDADVFAIGLVTGAMIEFVWLIEHGQRLPNSVISLAEPDRPAAWCVRQQRELITHNRLELGNYLEAVLPPISGQPMETVVYLPLLAEQQVIGCLSVQSPTPHAYSEDQIEFLRILASYTAIAMANSAAHQGLSQSHEELTVALSHLQETQARLIQAERQQISLDLHDNLSQTMTGVLLQLATARTMFTQEQNQVPETNRPKLSGLPYVERAMEMAREGHAQTRQLLKALRSAKLKQHKPIHLLDTLRRDLPRLIMGTGIVVEVQQEGEVIPLNGEVELALFRIAQESVTNALRHGKAKKILLVLSWSNHDVTLSVQDDGIGFDPGCKTVVPGIGLLGMQERVADLSGSFTMDTASGRGTCIRVVLPLFPD